MAIYDTRRLLIWGKTGPELSSKYLETVCTGAVLEDGTPIRLYPIPFRYLDGTGQFAKYQWITARVSKSLEDARPESHIIDCNSIELGPVVPPDPAEWLNRRSVVFQQSHWIFDSMSQVHAAQQASRRSLAIVAPKTIIGTEIRKRTAAEAAEFRQKQADLRRRWEAESEGLLFDECMPPQPKGLDFVESRVAVKWVCGDGKQHDMQILDWEVIELLRREGEAAALAKVNEILDLSRYATKFYLGNMKLFPGSFTIIGLWYPLRQGGLLF